MNFFQYLFCNQYAEIKDRGGDGRRAQANTLILSAVLISLYIIIVFLAYDYLYPGFVEKNLSMSGMNGRSIGRFLAAVISLIVFFTLKFLIGNKTWYDQTVEQFTRMLPEEQKRVAKKGIQYFVIASLPVAIFIGWALISVF